MQEIRNSDIKNSSEEIKETPKGKLRVGVFLNSFELYAWQYALLEKIINSNYARLEVIILNTYGKPKRSLKKAVYFSYIWLDNKISRVDRDVYGKKDPKELKELLADIPAIKITPIRKKFLDYFNEKDIEKIKSLKLDVIIRMGFRILRGGILGAARYGIWSYHHADNSIMRGNPPGFWETFNGWPITGCVLQILTEDLDNGKVIYESWSLTHPLSVARNRLGNFWKSVSFIPRKLEELHRIGREKFFEKVEEDNKHPFIYSSKLYTNPGNFEMTRLVAKHLFKVSCATLKDAYFLKQWILMFELGGSMSPSFRTFKKIIPPKDRFWADPFVIHKDGKYYVFIEEGMFKTDKGHISLIVMDHKGNYKKPVKLLDKDHHMSYPFVFELDKKYYMIPETHFNKTVDIYECVSFPDKWKFKMNLMDNIRAVDTTPFHYRDKWWLFMNIVENEGASYNDELFLFYSDDLFTNKWTPHPLNPIISDIRTARPAGKIFEINGEIYRPSQNHTGFNINRIIVLNEKEYKEEIVSSVKPNWDEKIIRTHTFTHEGELTIIDGILKRPRWF